MADGKTKIFVPVEGGRTDVALMRHLLSVYEIDAKYEIISYNTNIYSQRHKCRDYATLLAPFFKQVLINKKFADLFLAERKEIGGESMSSGDGLGRERRRRRRSAVLGMLAGLACCLLASCTGEWAYDPITDVDNLEGRRVGVNLSWETDYALSGREDMTLYRYDTVADQIMALNYDKLDALAMDGLMWLAVSGLSNGLERVEPAFGMTGYTLYFNRENEILQNEFNAFLADYKKTEEYRDLLKREASFDGVNYDGPDIPLTGTGQVLRVAIESEGFPRTFREPGEDIPTGFDLEPLKRFANDRDYRLEFVMSNYEDGVLGLMNGLYDIQVGYLSDLYAEEVRATGLYVSDTMDEMPLYFVQKTQRDISVQLDEIE